jgi:hypothetical protein
MPAPPQREAEALAMTQGFETYNRYGVRAVAEEHWHPDVEWHVGPWAVVLGGQTQSGVARPGSPRSMSSKPS